jgi:hypothetical protein
MVFNLAAQRPIADNHKMRFPVVGKHAGCGFDKKAMSFDRLKPCNYSYKFHISIQPQLASQSIKCRIAIGIRFARKRAYPVSDDDYLMRSSSALGNDVIANRFRIDQYAMRKAIDDSMADLANFAIRKFQMSLAGYDFCARNPRRRPSDHS